MSAWREQLGKVRQGLLDHRKGRLRVLHRAVLKCSLCSQVVAHFFCWSVMLVYSFLRPQTLYCGEVAAGGWQQASHTLLRRWCGHRKKKSASSGPSIILVPFRTALVLEDTLRDVGSGTVALDWQNLQQSFTCLSLCVCVWSALP